MPEINAPLDEIHEMSVEALGLIDEGFTLAFYKVRVWRLAECPPHPDFCDGYPHDWDIQEVEHRYGTREYTVCTNCGHEAGQPTFPPREEV